MTSRFIPLLSKSIKALQPGAAILIFPDKPNISSIVVLFFLSG